MQNFQDNLSAQLRGRDVLYVTLVTGVLTGAGIATLLGLTGVLTEHQSTRPALNLGVLLGSILILNGAIIAAVSFVLVRVRRMTWRDLGFVRPSVLWALGSVALGIVLVAAIEGIERTFDSSAGQLTAWLIAPDGFTWFGLVGAVALIGFLAPFGEELYFRGLIYRWLRDQWSPAIAAPLSALLFAATHFYYPLPQMLLVVLFGLVLAIAYERSGSLWVSVGIHATQNTTVVVLIYWTLA